MLSETEIRALFDRVTEQDGPVKILIYRARSGKIVEYVAHSLTYGQLAAGDTPDEALSDLVEQLTTFLEACESADQHGERFIDAPNNVRMGFGLGSRFDAPGEIAGLPISVRLDVQQVYEVQGDDELDEFVKAAAG